VWKLASFGDSLNRSILSIALNCQRPEDDDLDSTVSLVSVCHEPFVAVAGAGVAVGVPLPLPVDGLAVPHLVAPRLVGGGVAQLVGLSVAQLVGEVAHLLWMAPRHVAAGVTQLVGLNLVGVLVAPRHRHCHHRQIQILNLPRTRRRRCRRCRGSAFEPLCRRNSFAIVLEAVALGEVRYAIQMIRIVYLCYSRLLSIAANRWSNERRRLQMSNEWIPQQSIHSFRSGENIRLLLCCRGNHHSRLSNYHRHCREINYEGNAWSSAPVGSVKASRTAHGEECHRPHQSFVLS
jgi:hypothetical protein